MTGQAIGEAVFDGLKSARAMYEGLKVLRYATIHAMIATKSVSTGYVSGTDATDREDVKIGTNREEGPCSPKDTWPTSDGIG